MNLESFWDDFNVWIEGKPDATSRRYLTILRLLCEFRRCLPYTTEGRGRLISMTGSDALKFMQWYRARPGFDGKGSGDLSTHNTYACTRNLYQFWSDMGYCKRNPFALIKTYFSQRQRVQKRPTKLIPLDKVQALLRQPDPRTKGGRRDRAILALLIGGALRRGEVFRLNVGSIVVTPHGEVALGRTKAGKLQTQVLPAWATLQLVALISQRKTEGAENDSPLFCFYSTQTGEPRGRYSYRSIHRMFKRRCESLGLPGYAPHSARATAITKALIDGHDRDAVRRFSRHSKDEGLDWYDKRTHKPKDSVGFKISY